MKVTSIKQQVKNPQRVSVFVDSKYSFSLSLDELVKERLKNDEELSPADIKRLKKLSADGKLRARALEWLLNRPRSESEFRDYLFRKKAEPEQIKVLIREFAGKGYLDDVKFASWFVELKIRKGGSNRSIRSELFKKGVSREAVDDIMSLNAEDESERLKRLVAKKKQLPRYKKDPRKLAEYLTRQGFNWQLVKEALQVDSVED